MKLEVGKTYVSDRSTVKILFELPDQTFVGWDGLSSLVFNADGTWKSAPHSDRMALRKEVASGVLYINVVRGAEKGDIYTQTSKDRFYEPMSNTVIAQLTVPWTEGQGLTNVTP